MQFLCVVFEIFEFQVSAITLYGNRTTLPYMEYHEKFKLFYWQIKDITLVLHFARLPLKDAKYKKKIFSHKNFYKRLALKKYTDK